MRVNDFPDHLVDKRVSVVVKDRLNQTQKETVGTLQPYTNRDGRVTFVLEDVESSRFGAELFNVQEVDEINEA